MRDRLTVLAVIPARGGSKGLPGKNVRPFAGLPLIAHTILFAKLCPEITRAVVSTDSPEIADVAKQFGGEAPFLRPKELAGDEASIWQVLRHALAFAEQGGRRFDALLLLDPTSPAREPSDVTTALQRLAATPEADGVIGVSQPELNPISHGVVLRDGWMTPLIAEGMRCERRQEIPTAVYHINGSLYLWRTAFVRREAVSWYGNGRHLIHEIPERRAMSIDTLEQFERAELLVTGGLVTLPWLSERVVMR